MPSPRSIWRSLVQGLMWGGLAALANILIFPVLFELQRLVESVSYGWGWPGPTAIILEGAWWIYLIFGFRLFFTPSVIGGGILSLILHFLVPMVSKPSRQGLWVGSIIGGAVALGGLCLLFFVVGSHYWILEGLVCIVEIVIYAWIGRRIALSYQRVEPEAQSTHMVL